MDCDEDNSNSYGVKESNSLFCRFDVYTFCCATGTTSDHHQMCMRRKKDCKNKSLKIMYIVLSNTSICYILRNITIMLSEKLFYLVLIYVDYRTSLLEIQINNSNYSPINTVLVMKTF